ncbi:MAG: glutamate-5-semialdehyde dehydrogenase [Phycisphaera sp.]|nr:glutamate-5-semialdehyde dehydrogenase [Phycisphaera sp.]
MSTATQRPSTTLDTQAHCEALATNAQRSAGLLVNTDGSARNAALRAIARKLVERTTAIVADNARDLGAGRAAGLSDAMLDRLTLDEKRIAKMARSVEQIADQPDPVGQVIEGRTLPNGIRLQKLRVPIGVVLMIYESRPNVTSDAAALCIKSGNAVILRGGKEAMHSNAVIAECVRQGLEAAKLPGDAVQLVGTTDRAAVGMLLKMEGRIDLAIPRGGESLIRAVVEQSRIPVIKHYTGNCHVYVDADCDDEMAVEICLNAKTQRPGVCNAAETILFHKKAAERGLVYKVCEALDKKGVEIRADERVRTLFAKAKPATQEDWATEYLDLIVAIGEVPSVDAAIEHINKFGSKHTDAIVTSDIAAADAFVQRVDSANVFVNCSTRFSDGGEYGLGAEIGISTDKLHARGPMGAADLTTYKWVAHGSGQVRT